MLQLLHKEPAKAEYVLDAAVASVNPIYRPSLVDVAARGPWMHDGRARSLRDAVLLGEGHGAARHLDAERLSDLLRYLESL